MATRTVHSQDLKQLSDLKRAVLETEVNKLSKSNALEYLALRDGLSRGLVSRSLIFLLHKVYGPDVERLKNQIDRIASMATLFAELYGDGPVDVLRAPARINILGEHVDYVSYLPTQSLPFGSREHDMLMLFRASANDRVQGASTTEDYPAFSFALSDGPDVLPRVNVDADWVSYLFEHPAETSHWSNYVKGPAYFARIEFSTQVKHGFDFVVDSSIPAGGGASSSSALVVLAAAAVRRVNGIGYSPMELAREASKAEWYVGTRGGAMDHITIALAQQDHAVLISYPDQEAQLVRLPAGKFRWITFFSTTADKGREVMIEYNERAAISRIVLPALIAGWKTKNPENYELWQAAVRSIDGSGSLDEVERLLSQLPDSLTLSEIGAEYGNTLAECARSFPALVAERAERPLKIRARALHHLGEIRRVRTATKILEGVVQGETDANEQESDRAMKLLGSLLNQSHQSLRDLYQVSTPDVERLTEIIRSTPGVYGARLMGGGFGGNVLALTVRDTVETLIKRTQAEYYEPQNRDGAEEGSIMISTPGDGLREIDVENVWREVVEEFNSLSDRGLDYRNRLIALLDDMPVKEVEETVWPVIVAAGKGTRSLASGLTTPKPLASVLQTPSIVHVIQNIRIAFGVIHPPIVIVSPETESETRSLLKDEVTFVVQREALGTGDAVLSARQELNGFSGRTLIIWSTQPVVRPETMRRTLKLAELFSEYDMVLPTTHKEWPYAPVLRDDSGKIQSARETHLEQADKVPFGESNIGMFLLKNRPMFAALTDLHQQYWNETERRYNRPGGELGFPNELVNYFAERNNGVFACAIADSREEQGIKRLADINLCERFICELAKADS
jgi:galactokinase/CTP:molybdopterin cytidylyltransferase MocA